MHFGISGLPFTLVVVHPSFSAGFTPRRFYNNYECVARKVKTPQASNVGNISNYPSNRSTDFVKSIRDFRYSWYRCENYRSPGKSRLAYILSILSRKYISFLLENECPQPRNSATPDRWLEVSGRRWRIRAEFPLGRARGGPSTALSWEAHFHPDRLPVPTDSDLARAGDRRSDPQSFRRFLTDRAVAPQDTRTPCSRWKARSLLRCGRPTDGAVEAFGSARRDSCESVTLRCGGRLKRPPITFHPLRSRARHRPTLLRASPSSGTARYFANRGNVRKRLLKMLKPRTIRNEENEGSFVFTL